MTDEHKKQIVVLRKKGLGYKRIAADLGLPVGTVKSFCRRNDIQKSDNPEGSYCEFCGSEITQIPGRKKKRFCSDECRNKWWNTHLDQVDKRAVYKFKCIHCGKEFESYGNKKRKYCSHECYIKHRFGGDVSE